MNPVPKASVATLEQLARWLTVREGTDEDRLLLASAWQRLPAQSPNRLFGWLGLFMVVGVVASLSAQALLTDEAAALVPAAMLAVFGLGVFWRIRHWFWASEATVSATGFRLDYRGWGTPAGLSVPLAEIRALRYRLRDGQLDGLALAHGSECSPLPFSGQRELDKLYCNLLRHLLQKYQPNIAFERFDSPDQP